MAAISSRPPYASHMFTSQRYLMGGCWLVYPEQFDFLESTLYQWTDTSASSSSITASSFSCRCHCNWFVALLVYSLGSSAKPNMYLCVLSYFWFPCISPRCYETLVSLIHDHLLIMRFVILIDKNIVILLYQTHARKTHY